MQTCWTGSDERFEEVLSEVLSDVPAIALLDHLNRRSAELPEALEVCALALAPTQ
jgi:hypothetical protein